MSAFFFSFEISPCVSRYTQSKGETSKRDEDQDEMITNEIALQHDTPNRNKLDRVK